MAVVIPNDITWSSYGNGTIDASRVGVVLTSSPAGNGVQTVVSAEIYYQQREEYATNVTLYYSWDYGQTWHTYSKTLDVSDSLSIYFATRSETFYNNYYERGFRCYTKSTEFGTTSTVEVLVATTVTTCNLHYNANGGTGAPSSATAFAGDSPLISSTLPTKSGYTFVGWSRSDVSDTADYVVGDRVLIDAITVTLYAVWTLATAEWTNGLAWKNDGGTWKVGIACVKNNGTWLSGIANIKKIK